MQDRFLARKKRHGRSRKKILGTGERPRVNVYRSLKHIYVQAVDDTVGHTLASACTERLELARGGNIPAAGQLGKHFAELLQKKGIKKIVFDRGGYLFHGRVKALATAMREGGLQF